MQFKRLILIATVLLSFSVQSFAQEATSLNHGSPVHSVAFSPVDASLIASAGEDGTIKLWNLWSDTGTTLRGHNAQVNSVAFSSNGALLASGSDDHECKLWDVQNRQTIATLQHITGWNRSQVKAVAFSPDGQLLATAGWDVKLWEVSNQTEIATLQHDEWVWAVAFSPNGQLLATGDTNGRVKVWDVQDRQMITQLEADTTGVYTVAFSPDGRTLASAGYQGRIKLWAVANWELLGTLHSQGTVSTVDFFLDGTALASTGYGAVTLWSVESGEKIASLTGHIGWVNGVTFSPDGTAIASGGNDRTVRVQNIESLLQPQSSATVRVVYFLPNDRWPQQDIETKLDTLIKQVQRFYADQMQINGFGRKTFTFETGADRALRVYRVDGNFDDRYYHTNTFNKVIAEISEEFDTSKYVYLIVADISSERIGHEDTCGRGGGNWIEVGALRRRTGGGTALIPASGNCFDDEFGVETAAHELGHTFGLAHDFRNDAYLMSYGSDRTQLSQCAAEWLDVNRSFNADQTAFNEPATIQMLPPLAYPSNAISLRFKITDTDGLHQAQLLTLSTVEGQAPGFSKLLGCKRLNGESKTFEFITTELTIRFSNEVTLQVIDVYGNITRRIFTFRDADILPAPNSGVPTALEQISGDNQQGAPRRTLPNPFVVKVTDDNGSALEGIDVTFAVIAGGGTLSQTTVISSSNGQAESTLTLGNSEGTNTVEVSVSGIQVVFNAEGIRIPATLLKISGDNQQGYPGVALEQPLIVEVHDAENYVLGGIDVTFAVTAGGGTLSETTVITSANGRAQTTLTLGPDVGTNTVSVSVAGIQPPVTFNAEGVRIPTALLKISGDNQQGYPGVALENPFVVEVQDSKSLAFEGVLVTFTVTTGGGVLSETTVTTSTDGRAQTTLTLGSDVGTNTVSVSVAGIQSQVTFNTEGVRIPTVLLKISGDNQQGYPGVALENPFVVEVQDNKSLTLEGVLVTFTVTTGGGVLSETTVTTSTDGRAQTTLTLGPDVGTNTVSVSVAGIQPPVTFNAEGVRIPTALLKISGDNQQGESGAALTNPFVVEVQDNKSLALEGVLVTFTVTTGGGTLSQTTVTTDDNGRAESMLTLGSSAGTNTVEVSAIGIQQKVVFNAEEIRKAIVGDVNQDGVVNIFDLVLVAGRFGESGQNSADINGDGVVNIFDLVLVAGAFGNTAVAPAMHPQALEPLTTTDVKQWLVQARGLALTDARSQRGIIFLENLLAALTPKKTGLLPNYPNPFNPETWIPYRLAEDADVQLTIYDTKGAVVRRLDLGHQPAGFYTARAKAVYWNGRNESGERIASGVYFYQLRAGNYSALRRMVIVK